MGATDVKITGYPKNQIRGSDFTYSPGCGGAGGGSCVSPASFRYIWWYIYPTSFIVKNRKLVLQNLDFKSYLDAGSDGFCAHSNGASQDFDVLLVHQPPSGDVQDETYVKTRVTIPGSQVLPYNIQFEADSIPQPTDSLWSGVFYVVVDLKTTGRMVDGHLATDTLFKTVNYDYDERL